MEPTNKLQKKKMQSGISILLGQPGKLSTILRSTDSGSGVHINVYNQAQSKGDERSVSLSCYIYMLIAIQIISLVDIVSVWGLCR